MTLLAPAPTGVGCLDCLRDPDGWWLYLRRCVSCGAIGCCDASPARHARAHAEQTGHAVAVSFEPDEHWYWNFESERYVLGQRRREPLWRPAEQPTPAPRHRLPADWRARLR